MADREKINNPDLGSKDHPIILNNETRDGKRDGKREGTHVLASSLANQIFRLYGSDIRTASGDLSDQWNTHVKINAAGASALCNFKLGVSKSREGGEIAFNIDAQPEVTADTIEEAFNLGFQFLPKIIEFTTTKLNEKFREAIAEKPKTD